MTINSSVPMQPMQMENMYGSGNGNGGMRDIMQSLSQDQRVQLRDQMSSLSMEDRQNLISQMQQIDKSNMSSQEYFNSLMDLINQTQNSEIQMSYNSFSIYA